MASEVVQNEPPQSPEDFARTVVTALYRTLLLREPDDGGLTHNIQTFVQNGSDLEASIRSTLACAEFRDKLPAFARHYCLDLPFMTHVSQHGEIPFLIREMVNEAAVRRYVVDVGARGRERSNSYDLMKHFDWSGFLVEANPNLIEEIHKEFQGLNYRLMNCAVSDYVGEATFHVGINDDVSSLEHLTAANWGKTRAELKVRVERLQFLLADADVPYDFDLLSLDIEGEDIRVLNDLLSCSKYRPRWILIEIPPITIKHLTDLPFVSEVIESYRLVTRIGPNLVLRLK